MMIKQNQSKYYKNPLHNDRDETLTFPDAISYYEKFLIYLLTSIYILALTNWNYLTIKMGEKNTSIFLTVFLSEAP